MAIGHLANDGITMKTWTILGTALVLSIAAQSTIAATYDGTQPLLCVPISIVSCAPGADCEKETPESINLPQFITVDVPANKITGTKPDGEALATTIDTVRHVEDDLAMQGVQGRMVWSVTVDKASGSMALTVLGDGTGYVAFGACTLR